MKYSYLLVIVPPKKIVTIADKYRKIYAKYTSYHLPPHITICPPFFLEDLDEGQIKKLLKNQLLNSPSGKLCLNSYGYFSGKNNVAYFKPDIRSTRYLKSVFVKTMHVLKKHISSVYQDYKITANIYHPHMTIAEKIPNDVLSKIKNELDSKKVKLEFNISSVKLYRQHINSNIWQPITNINFSYKV